MAWMARLDAKAARWPPLWRGLYLLIKWTLVVMGAFSLAGWYAERLGIWNPYG